MKPDITTHSSPFRRLTARAQLPVLLACFLLCAGSAAWVTGIFQSGLRLQEVHLLTELHADSTATESEDTRPFLLQQPVTRLLLRLSPRSASLPETVRVIPVLAGIISIVLLFMTARYSTARITSIICLVLAFSSALWMTASQTFGFLSCSLAGLVGMQCAFTGFDAQPSWRRILIYLFSLGIGVLLTPLSLVLAACHAVWCLLYCIRSLFPSANRKNLPAYLVTAVLGLGILSAVSATAGLPKLNLTPSSILATYPVIAENTFVSLIAGRPVPLTLPGSILAWLIGISIITAVISCVVTRSRVVCAWVFLSLLAPAVMFCITPLKPAELTATSVLLVAPFIILLWAEGVGFVITGLLRIARKSRLPATAVFLHTIVILACIGSILLWFAEQDAASTLIQSRRAPSDVSLPVQFLRDTLTTNDTLYVVVSAEDVSQAPETRYYLAPYLETECPAHIIQSTSFHRSGTSSWAVGTGLSPPPPYKMGGDLTLFIPFAVPILHVRHATDRTWFECYDLLQEAIRQDPENPVLRTPLYTLYSSAQRKNIQQNIISGTATRDLAAAGSLDSQKQPLKQAVSRVVASWPACSRENSDIFEQFIRAVAVNPLPTSQVIAVYSRYAKLAIAESNQAWCAEVIRNALQIDPNNIPLLRLAAQSELKRIPPQTLNAIAFNNRAREAYRPENGKPYFDAWFANILIGQNTNECHSTITQFIALRSAAQQEQARVTALITNSPPAKRPALMKWNTRCIFWEGQCNSYISHILTKNGQYTEALDWINYNLDHKFNPGHRKVAGDRLLILYEKSKDILGLFAHIDMLISNAPLIKIRIDWIIEKAHRQVTYEDPVGAYESLQRIYSLLANLPAEKRHAWSSDPRFKRVYRHIESQTKTDVRDTVIPVLLKRARADSSSGGWFYIQAAQLYRCQLKYAKAEETFKAGTVNFPDYIDNYLAGSLMQYQLKRYPKASILFTNMLKSVETSIDQLNTDWRYQVLSEFTAHRRPARLDDVLAWAAAHRTNFISDARYRNYTGNTYALFGEFDQATNEFFRGITTTDLCLDNYLDAGYLLCIRGNVPAVEKILNSINSLNLNKSVIERLDTDWRYIELYHVCGRPYSLKE